MWALGVCVYCMVLGELPFEGEDPLSLFDAIQEQALTFPEEVSEDCQQFILGLLEKVMATLGSKQKGGP